MNDYELVARTINDYELVANYQRLRTCCTNYQRLWTCCTNYERTCCTNQQEGRESMVGIIVWRCKRSPVALWLQNVTTNHCISWIKPCIILPIGGLFWMADTLLALGLRGHRAHSLQSATKKDSQSHTVADISLPPAQTLTSTDCISCNLNTVCSSRIGYTKCWVEVTPCARVSDSNRVLFTVKSRFYKLAQNHPKIVSKSSQLSHFQWTLRKVKSNTA